MQNIADELRSIITRFEPKLLKLNDSDVRVRNRGPEKWSQIELLGHLVDSACNNQQKFVRLMLNPKLEFVGYRQDDWVAVQQYTKADWTQLVGLWVAYNFHIAYLIENANPESLSHKIFIEGAGPFELGFIMPDYVEHLKHHLKQIFPSEDLENQFVNVYGA